MTEGFVFYAYWNGAQMRDLFEALVSVTGGGNYVQLAGLLFLVGLIFVLAAGATRAEGKGAITYFACGVLFWFVVMVPKVSVVIQDTRSEAVWTVDNVPLGIAVPGSMANRIGHWLTSTYETAFAPADVARFSRFGAVYPERVLEALQAVGPVTVQGQATLQAVVKGCVIPELLTDAAKTAAVATSTDLWTTISADGWVNPARMTAMPDGSVKACSDALGDLQTVLTDTELPAVRRLLGTKLAPDHADPGAVLATAVPASEELLLNLSRTMDASLRHSVMMTGISTAVDEEAQVSEPLALTVALAKAQGNM
ncbi:MAG: conjugal transfer protein TraG N-terminal domain-containing protein, partial [Duodenibacillus sp.]|nr:conjugal transfer protein TraG N-terminal domain-containing protein [Duodenibacillus sp.]